MKAQSFSKGPKRKRIKSRREVPEEFPLNLFNASAIGLYVVQDRRFKLVNPRFQQLTGYREEELIGMESLNLVLPDDRKKVRGNAIKMLKGEHSSPYEFRVVHKGGEVRWVVETVTPIHHKGKRAVLGNFMDITERKQVMQMLRESEKKYRALFEESRDAIFVTRVDGEIMDFNRACLDLLGYTREDISSMNIYDLYVNRKERDTVTREVEKEGFVRDHGIRLVRKDGTVIDCLLTSALKRDNAGRILGYQGVIRDISDQMLMEAALRSSREQLRRLSVHLQTVREEERKHVAREIHDELGQVLTALKMELTCLRKRLPRGEKSLIEETESMLKLVGRAIQRVQKICSELRPGILDDFGLGAAIKWQAEEFQSQTGIECKVATNLGNSIFHPDFSTAIFRIFQETLTNVARHAGATRIEVSLRKNAGKMELKVRDNGKGIERGQIFHPNSLGLMGIRERARFWKGKVTISGRRGKGTTVFVSASLPI